MKNIVVIFIFVVGIISCTKKTSSKTSSSSSATTAVSSPSVNTSVIIGGTGWAFDGCATTPNRFRAINGSAIATLDFGPGAMAQGTYSFTSGVPLTGQVRLTIFDPPGQPSGFTWYSNNLQSINVFSTTPGSTIAIFNTITCSQSATSTPIVTASGTMACF